MEKKKYNPKTTKVGQKCTLHLPGTELSYVQFLGIKSDLFLYKDLKNKYIIYGLKLPEAMKLVMNY